MRVLRLAAPRKHQLRDLIVQLRARRLGALEGAPRFGPRRPNALMELRSGQRLGHSWRALDPSLWSDQERCNCTHYWEQSITPPSVQSTLWRDEQGTLWEINELRRWMKTDLSS